MIKETKGATVITGAHIGVFRLLQIKHGLLLEMRVPGLKMSRHGSALLAAKLTLGLKPRSRLTREDALARIESLLETTTIAADASEASSTN